MWQRTEFGKLIATECAKNDWSHLHLANKIGVSNAFLSSVITGKKYLPYKRAVQLLSILGVEQYTFWDAYFSSQSKINLNMIPEKKRALVKSILATEVDDTILDSIQDVIDKLS